jgi:hypothetical protein
MAYAGSRTAPPRLKRSDSERLAAPDIVRIEPRHGLRALNLAELWSHRDLVYCHGRQSVPHQVHRDDPLVISLYLEGGRLVDDGPTAEIVARARARWKAHPPGGEAPPTAVSR